MNNKKFFANLKKSYFEYNRDRGMVIGRSREILKYAKEAIFACHRNQLSAAKRSLESAEKIIKQINTKANTNRKLYYEGSFRASLEEYAEAKLFYNFLMSGSIQEIKGVKLDHDIYIGALSDFTGELIRKAIALATNRNVKEVEKIKTVIEEVMEQFIKFDLLSHLRSKYDAARKNLRKIEEILYDLAISERK